MSTLSPSHDNNDEDALTHEELECYEEFLMSSRESGGVPASHMAPLQRYTLEVIAERAERDGEVELGQLARRAIVSISLDPAATEQASPLNREEYAELMESISPGSREQRERHEYVLSWIARSNLFHLIEAAYDELASLAEHGPYVTTSDLAAERAEIKARRLAEKGSSEAEKVRETTRRTLLTLQGDWIPRAQLDDLGLPPTSVDRHYESYGPADARRKNEGRREYRRGFLIGFVTKHWKPRIQA